LALNAVGNALASLSPLTPEALSRGSQFQWTESFRSLCRRWQHGPIAKHKRRTHIAKSACASLIFPILKSGGQLISMSKR
jgi:hypothetical protein